MQNVYRRSVSILGKCNCCQPGLNNGPSMVPISRISSGVGDPTDSDDDDYSSDIE